MANAQYKRDTGERKKAGKYLQGLRKAVNMTQIELANALGYPYYTFISQIEGGLSRVPPEGYSKWAKVLRVNEAEFASKLLSFYDPHTYRSIFGK
jgi:transcriptional regulator with XRE-family HTH domain